MAKRKTAKQIAASKRNIKIAQAAAKKNSKELRTGIATAKNPVGGWTPKKIQQALKNIKNRKKSTLDIRTKSGDRIRARRWTDDKGNYRGPL